MDCPSNKCGAGASRLLTVAEINWVSPQHWLSTAEICTSCRCVHAGGIVRGYLDSKLLGKGWIPAQ